MIGRAIAGVVVAAVAVTLFAVQMTGPGTTEASGDIRLAGAPLALQADPTPTAGASPTVVIADPQGTIEPIGGMPSENEDNIGRGTLIVGGLTIVVALLVVASVGRRRWWR